MFLCERHWRFKTFFDYLYPNNILREPIETFPDPIPYTDLTGVEHYKAGKDSNEKFMMSKLIDATKRKTNIPFPTSAQTAPNVGIFLCCINCRPLRLCSEKSTS